jgi:MFS family permease
LSRFSGGLVTRIGARIPLVLGALLAASAFVIFSFAGVGKSYWVSFFPGAVLLGLGGASFVAPLTTTVMDAVSTARAGVASGINNAVARTAGLVAIAALGIALAGGFESSVELHLGQMHGVSAATVAIVKANAGTIVTGVVPAQITDPAARDAVRAAVKQTFAAQFQLVMLVTAVLALIAAGIGFDGSFRRVPASR